MVILKPMLPEDIRKGVEGRLSKQVEKNKGKIKSSDIWGKKHLAYPINTHEEGYYIVYKLEVEPSKVTELESEIKLINDILRYTIVREDNQ